LNSKVNMEVLVSLCKRRGFIFQSSEPYGGIGGFWDYGPVGVELRSHIKNNWWKEIVRRRDDVVGLDSSIIAHPKVWVASGHVDHFSDPMVDCKKCKARFRADQLEGSSCPEKPSKSPGECGGELTEARSFNLMFKTHVGPLEDVASIAYLRPETCQSIFTQFKNVQNTARKKIPFGIAQIGKSFRNEITPRNFIFRSREFEQMEMEFFVNEQNAQETYEYWVGERFSWFQEIGVNKKNLRIRAHTNDELAHYARGCSDIEYEFPFGWSELEGIANRGNYDLTQHSKVSGKDLSYYDDDSKAKFIPHVIETSVGVDRTLLTILCDAYDEETVEGEKRVVMRFSPHIAPFQLAIFPLSKKLSEPCQKIAYELRNDFVVDYDDIGSIGKRYRRHDEIGTPFCVTYDFDSQSDTCVTVRERDSMQQERINIDALARYLKDKLK
jgi:glycyl-tRNA synthetase